MGLSGGWRADPIGLALALVLAGAYLAGSLRWRRSGGRLPVLRTVSFGAGLVVLLAATVSPLGVAARRGVEADVVQFCLLLLVAAPLLAAGEPVRLWRGARNTRPRWTAPLALAVATPVLAAVITMVWFFSPWYAASWRQPVLDDVGVAVLIGCGWLISLPVLRAVRTTTALGYAPLVFASFLELLLDSVPGIVLTFNTHLLAAGAVLARTGARPAAALAGQRTGGEILWVVGEVIDLPVVAALVWQWARQDAREQVVVDRLLEERRTARRQSEQPAARVPLDRPWWEEDASVFGGRRARGFRRD